MKEGNAYSNMLLLMKNQGYNKDISIYVGKVTSSSPLKIDLGNGLILEDDDVTVTDTASKAVVQDRVLVINDGNNFYAIDKVVN